MKYIDGDIYESERKNGKCNSKGIYVKKVGEDIREIGLTSATFSAGRLFLFTRLTNK